MRNEEQNSPDLLMPRSYNEVQTCGGPNLALLGKMLEPAEGWK